MTTAFTLPDPAEAKVYFKHKMQFTTGPVELERMMKEKGKFNIVDVRAAEDFQKGHIPGAVNLPKDKWQTFEGLRKDEANVLYCYTQQCHLAATAALQFATKGFPVMELEGGFDTWQKSKLPVEEPGHAKQLRQAALPVVAALRERTRRSRSLLQSGA